MATLTPTIEYSIIIPVYNEEQNLPELYRRITSVMESITSSYEVVFINDGSRDSSLRTLIQFRQSDDRVKIVDFSRNFGHQIAVTAGLDHVRGKAVITMDADLQDPPEVIPNLIRMWQEGNEVVYAIRKKREEGFLKRLAYSTFYRLLSRMSAIKIPLDSGDFSLMDEKVVRILRSMPERTKFIRGLRSWIGFKQVGMEYERAGRYAGRPKYTFSRLMKLALDGFVAFSSTPLQLASYMGFIIASFSFVSAAYYLYSWFFVTRMIRGFATTIIVILFLGGVQLITLGIIGEYIGRIFEEVKFRPIYIVRKKIGFSTDDPLILSERASSF